MTTLLARVPPEFWYRQIWEFAIGGVAFACAWWLYRRRRATVGALHEAAGRLANRQALSIGLVAALPVALRLLLLPWVPPPTPLVHDEFSHLLVADTLQAGRLANPPLPAWEHFETLHVLQQPAHVSKYPIGQGLSLAIGELVTGHPWGGVLLGVSAMTAAVTWMLYAWLPPTWALLGGWLCGLTYGVSSYWMNSYWGGAFCAFAGALGFGAARRLAREPSARLGWLLGLAWAIVWLTRPYEGVLLAILVGVYLVLPLRRPQVRRRWATAAILPVSVCVAAAAALTLVHNRQATGHAWTVPYQAYQRQYGMPQGFLWQAPVPPGPVYRYPILWENYELQRKQRLEGTAPHTWFREIVRKLGVWWRFYLNYWFTLPLAFVWFALRDRAVRLLAILAGLALAWNCLFTFFYPHYLAAYTGVFLLLVLAAMREWHMRSGPLGRAAIAAVIACALSVSLRGVTFAYLAPPPDPDRLERSRIRHHLERLGGRHLVLVRDGPRHNAGREWVYNPAVAGTAAVLWARELDPGSDRKLLQAYPGRRVWVVHSDRVPALLIPYELAPPHFPVSP